MANRYDIVRIDFQASARGANAAIESLRQEAEKSNAELTKIRGNIDNALKAGAPDEVIAGMRAEAKAEERRYKQLTQAQNELIKGMRVLDQGVKMFNDGSLSQMNAAFQKAVNNAATLAQSKMDKGTQSWREMGAIMQETQQNYARMQRDTEQLIQVIQNGGTVFRSTLEAEKKGIQELMWLVPYMGSEYQKLEGQLQVVTTKIDQMATAERQMKGEIVTANDARRVAYQLTEEGAAAAKREAEAAEQTIAASKERISVLEQERKTREDAARATAETVAKRNEDLAMQRDVIESIEKEIGKEDRKSKKKREAADAAKATAEESVKAVETEKAALEGLQTTTKAAEDEVKRLEGELSKLGTQKVQPKVEADTSEAKKEFKNLTDDIKKLDGMISELKKQRDALNASQQKSTAGMEGEAKSAQDLIQEMKRLNDEIDKQKGKLLKPEKEYQKSLQLATAAKKPEDRDRLIAEAEQKLNEKTAKTKGKIQELEKQLDKAREAYKALTKEEDAATDAADDEAAAVQKLIQARDKLVALNEKSTFHESVSGERTITNPREAENFLLQQMAKFDSGRVGKTQASVSKTNFEALRKAFGERYGMEKAEAEKWLKELAKPHGGIFTKGGQAGDGSYLFNIDPAQRVTYNKEKLQASKELGRTSIITDPAEAEKAYQAALKQVGATEQQAAAMGKLSGETQKQTQAVKEQAQATQKQNEADKDKAALDATIADLESRKQQAQEKLTQLQQQSAKAAAEQAEADKKETELKQQLAGAQQKLTEAQKAEEEQQKKISEATARANSDMEKSARLESELANAKADKTAKLEEEKKKLGELEAATEKDIELNNKRQQELQETNDKIAEEGNIIRKNQQVIAQANTDTLDSYTNAIRVLTEANSHLSKNSDEWIRNERLIGQMGLRVDELKKKSAELRGEARLDMMTQRIGNISSLSKDALVETKKFWQAMSDGADNNSPKLKTIEGNLKVIAEEERQRQRAALESSASRLSGNLGQLSAEEMRQSIDDAKKLQSTYRQTSQEAQQLAKNIVDAEEYSKRYGVEAERQARKEAEATRQQEEQERQLQQTMRQRLNEMKTLSADALTETRKYWEAQRNGAEEGSTAFKKAELAMRSLNNEQDRRTAANNERLAARLSDSSRFGQYSTAELNESIGAAKQLAASYKSGSDEAKALTQNIIAAEEHVSKYSLETERAAKKEADAIAEMRQQLSQGTSLTESALKAQESYWRRLADQPGLAADKVQEYIANMKEAQMLQRAQTQLRGIDAFNFFDSGQYKNASADTIEEHRKALLPYRDSLPSEGSADRINHINQLLEEQAQRAKELSGEWMSLSRAEEIASRAGTDGFFATGQQMQQATQAIERQRDALIKTIQQKQRDGEATAKEEQELARLEKILKDLKFEQDNFNMSHKQMNDILKQPKNAEDLEQLKAAIKRADGELHRMKQSLGENNKQYQEFAKTVKNAKNELKQMEGQAKATASSFDKAWSRLKTYVGLYVSAAVAMQKLTGTMGDLMELSDKMGEVRKTTGFTADEVGRLSNELKKMDTRTTLNGLMELSAAAGQLGLNTQEDVQGFTEAANKLMVALPEMGREGATEMLKVALATGEIDKIRKQMEAGLIDGSSATAVAMEKVGSTIDRLRATSASTAPAITDFVKRVGAVGAQSGITIDQVAALGSTVDALGMRVEMSATALSRMIPAIRNNAFDLAQVIGVTPDTIRNLFDTGRGMEVILMILQHIKDAGMDADSIEGMLGMGNMKEIMKELNQQGARAGIVFGGLSQNVDELRRQLGVAAEAYEENIAIQQEYDKMNETTAAKWERLKNQLEEIFVGDRAQRFFGSIIDGLRGVVDIVADAFNSWLRYLVILYSAYKVGIGQAIMVQLPKAFGSLLTTSGNFFKVMLNGLGALAANMGIVTARTRAARMAWGKLDVAIKQNVWGAVASAIALAAFKLVEWNRKIKESQKEIGRWAQEVFKSEQAVEKNFKAVDKANASLGEANKKLSQAKAALEKARKEMDGSKESTDRLTKAEENLKKAEDDVRIANDAHRASIEQINKLYGSYLGFMLSEISSAAELANARELINAKLRETITLKRREAALGRLEENIGEDRDEAYGALSQSLEGAIRRQVNIGGGKKGWVTDEKATADLLRQITKVAQDVNLSRQQAAEKIDQILINSGKSGDTWASWRAGVRNRALEYQKEYQNVQKKVREVEKQFDAEDELNREESQKLLDKQYQEADKTYAKIEKRHANAQGEAKKKAAADLLKQSDSLQDMINNAKNFYDLTNKSEKDAYDKFIKDSQARIDGIESQRDELLKEAGKYYKPVKGSSAAADVGETSPWGTPQPADSLNYADMNPKQLVARRHQMEQFVNAIQTDTDIQSVLAEDKALKAAIEKGMSSDMRTVIEWYNTERLKIQEELRSRHLTNEGHWLDPKKDRSGKSRTPVSDGAVAELERYYAWRKEMIEQARIEEGLTEEEFNRRIDVMEQEHMKKRSDLRVSFTTRDKKFIEDFHKWWASVEELEEVDWKLISDEWRAILLDAKNGDKQVKMNNMKAQKDLAAMERIVVKHLNAIDDILSKERPYDGITRNLQDNLTKMGILFADFDAEIRERIAKGETDVSIDAADEVLNRTKRLAFLLKEAEHAYNITITDLINTMRQEGFDAWADEILKDDKLQQALMAQLRTAYDAVQDAIKKEATQIKKQAEIQWNDTTIGKNGQQSQKQYFESLLAQLGLQEDAIKRANSLIGAGNASENVALRLAVKQMEIRLNMQAQYYALMRKIGQERANQLLLTAQEARIESERLKTEAARLRAEGKTDAAEQKERDAAKKDAEAIQATADRTHVLRSLDLATTEEQKKLDEQRVAIVNQLEEIQNNTYKSLKEWGDLLASSLQSLFEASHAGDKEYYNELAKLELTGKGGPGAGTYIVIENEGTSDAEAHYEYLDEREALDRQREIERQNAQAEAWRKVMDDINMKMSETITDQMNAMLQNASVDANTDAVGANTEAIIRATEALNSQGVGSGVKLDASMTGIEPSSIPEFDETNPDTWPRAMRKRAGLQVDGDPYNNTGGEAENTSVFLDPAGAGNFDSWYEQAAGAAELSAQRQIDASNNVAYVMEQNFHKQVDVAQEGSNKMAASSQSAFAKMTQAMNLYGIAYQAMSNDNLSATQKFEMIAIQAAGQAAITSLTTSGVKMVGDTAVQTPSVLSKIMAELGPIGGPIAFAAFTALLGGLMGVAMSKLTKAKSQIASVTGASSVGAGRLSTGMLTYAEGNVNEFTDPSTLTPGRQYNVDAADGKTYRARYMGRRAKTHITNGPEFHLSGEKGREMIIDADTTRQITLNERDIWHTIQTLSAGRRMPRRRLTGRGMAAFADGNVEDFEEMMSGYDVAANGTGGMSAEQSAALQASIDRQSDLLERALTEGIRGVFAVNGPDGLVNTYDKGKRQALRHGQQYP